MRICLIGAGNLATQLGMTLAEKGHQIVQVWSHTLKRAEELASTLRAPFTTDIDSIISDADIYIVAIKDEAIAPLLTAHSWGNALVVHTSGSIPVDILAPHCVNFGVFIRSRPLQSVKKLILT